MNFYPGTVTPRGIVTDQYDWFIYDSVNREILESKLQKLKNRFNETAKEGDYPFRAPVVVYWKEGMKKGRINMGHHRFELCKREGRKIVYVITDSPERANKDQVKAGQDWTVGDAVKSYAKEYELLGDELQKDYFVLQKLKNEYPRYSYHFLTCAFNEKGTGSKDLIENKFKINDTNKPLKVARERIEMYEEFLRVANRKDKSREILIKLIEALKNPTFDWNYFLKRTEINASEINMKEHFSSINTYAKAETMIEYIYNKNSRKNFYF